MTTFRRQLLLRLLAFFDLAVLGASLCLAVSAPFADRFSMVEVLAIRVSVRNVLVVAGLMYAWHWMFDSTGLYKSRRLSSQFSEIKDVLRMSAFAAGLLAVVAVTLSLEAATPQAIAIFFLISASTLILSRLVLRSALRGARKSGRNLRSILIVGTNNRAIEFARAIEARPELGYRRVGFVDDQWVGRDPEGKIKPAIVSDFEGFQDFLRTQVVDEVAVALPVKSFYVRSSHIVELCREQGIVVRVLSDLFSNRGVASVDQFETSPVITLYSAPFDGWGTILKRASDVAISTVMLLLLAPVYVIVAVLIKLDSSGPAFFLQDRVGLNKRRFRMCKFRTMVVNAEKLQAPLEKRNEATGPVFKIKDDPRITRLGKFLRKTSIDELPQLFNVLKGDMSLVGPRPLPVRDYEGFDQDWQRRRFSVRPGITCLWQISGRCSIGFAEWMDLDMRYIDQWSLWLDFKILAKTIPVVIKGAGAA